jgi:hypothetical protein
MGAMTVNEVRQHYGQPKVKEGDRVYVSAQWAELGSNKLSETQATNATGTDKATGNQTAQSAANEQPDQTTTTQKKTEKNKSGNSATAKSATAGRKENE